MMELVAINDVSWDNMDNILGSSWKDNGIIRTMGIYDKDIKET